MKKKTTFSFLDFLSATTIASFFAVPVLRSTLKVSELYYFLLVGLVIATSLMNLYLGRSILLNKSIQTLIFSKLTIFAWLIVSVMWSPAMANYGKDATLVLTLATLFLTLPFMLNRRVTNYLFVLLIIIGLFSSSLVYHGYIAVSGIKGYNVIFKDYYLTISKLIGVSTVGLSIHIMVNKYYISLVLILAYMFGALALSISRGALLGAMLIIATVVLFITLRLPLVRKSVFTYTKSIVRRMSGVFGIMGLFTALVSVAMMVDKIASRLTRLVEGEGSLLVILLDTRGPIWQRSWEAIQEAPMIGYGLGSSRAVTGDPYPHNMFLQVWLEAGIFPFILLFAVSIAPLVVFFRLINSKQITYGALKSLPYLGMYYFLLIQYSKSYNFYAGRELIILYVVTVCVLSYNNGK
jgi:O-antigen ligase